MYIYMYIYMYISIYLYMSSQMRPEAAGAYTQTLHPTP